MAIDRVDVVVPTNSVGPQQAQVRQGQPAGQVGAIAGSATVVAKTSIRRLSDEQGNISPEKRADTTSAGDVTRDSVGDGGDGHTRVRSGHAEAEARLVGILAKNSELEV